MIGFVLGVASTLAFQRWGWPKIKAKITNWRAWKEISDQLRGE